MTKKEIHFEKLAILDWITSHGCSPITRTPMVAADLVPNRALKEMILQHFLQESVPSPPVVVNVATLKCEASKASDNIELRTFIDNSKMLITVDPGDSHTRTFLNVSCVIDISGSMEAEATLVGENDRRESFGLTILDIVKHAVTTVIKSLTSSDRLAIITFSDSAQIVLPLTKMDENGQRMAINTLKCLRSYVSTNLWAGLEKGLNVLNTIDDKNEFNTISTVMLFTDGEPNIIPPRGHLPMLQMYKNKNGGRLPGSVNTFGFGYSLDSQLLHSLAKAGEGGYSFIPDSGFVGTIFVHAIANLKATVVKSCRLTIEPLNGATFVNARNDLGEYLTAEDTWGITVDIGSIQTGQTKDILLQMNNLPPEGTAYASINLNAKTRTNDSFKLSVECDSSNSNDRVIPTYYRFRFIETVKSVMQLLANEGDGNVTEANEIIQNLIEDIKNNCHDEHSLALLQDIKGQVIEAIKPDYFRRWGRHYLPSLIYAHLNQVCNNFKDPGPQVYGGSLFKALRDEADAQFCNLPPPEPTGKKFIKSAVTSPQQFLRSSARSFFSYKFHNARNVCFHGKGSVSMFDGATKTVESIIKGDRIRSINGAPATVICVVQTEIAGQMLELVNCQSKDGSNALLITPWHPIRLNQSQEWIFPISIAEPKIVRCDSVFNFVLDDHHIVNVDDIDCVTLGHLFEDSVCSHEYFGTTRVIDDLQAMSGFSSGLVKLIGVQRDPITAKVNGLIEA